MNALLEQLYLEIDAAGRAGLPLAPVTDGDCLLDVIDNFHRSSQRPVANQIADTIAKVLDNNPRAPMQNMTRMLAEDLGISPRTASKVARSLGFQVVAVRDGQRVFKTLQRGDAVQRRLAQRKADAASCAGRLAN